MEKTKVKRINSSAVEAVLPFMPTEENWGQEVSCVVQHEALLRLQVESLTVHGKDLKRNHKYLAAAFLCALLGTGVILFYVYRYRQKRRPKLRNITPSTDGSFSLNVDHFYPGNISISWEIFQPPSSENPRPLQSTALMERNQDGTFNVISTTESLRGKVNESEEYSLRASVTHKKLKHPSYREWSNQDKDNTRFVSPPELGEILAPSLMLSSPAQLQCTISRFYPDHLTVEWIKKVKDKEEIIETCEKYKITAHRSEEQRDKTFTCTAGLTLTPSLEDQGSEIICRVTHPGLKRPAERSTGQLRVKVKPTTERPITLSITDSGDVTAALSLLNFYPKDIKITWSYGRSQEKGPSEETTATGNPDGTFSINTKCNIPGEIFTQTDCKIKVTWKHETMDKEESREISVGHGDHPWRPEIVEMTPLILQTGKQTTVTCKISKFFPNNLAVTWCKKTGGSVTQCEGYPYTISSTPERLADNSYSCSSSLSFTATSQSEDPEFICKVSHPSLRGPIERSTGKAMTRVIPQMEKPVKFTLSESGRVRCRARFKKFYPSDIKITWTYGGNKPIPSTRKSIQMDGEQIFDAKSECEVPWEYFTSGVRVTWEHESLTDPQHQDLGIKDLPWRPVIERIDKPVFHVNTKATLQCKISQYFPNNLTVTWHKKGNLHQEWKTTPTAERQPDSTYSCTASLTVIPSTKDDGAEFICRAQQPGLERHIEQTTGPIQVYACPRIKDPIQWSLGQGGEVVATLYLQSFYPKTIKIRWSLSSNSSMETKETYEDNANSTYNVRSECRVAQENITDPDFRISVTWSHKSLGEAEKREVSIRDSGLPWRPTVSEIFTPTMRLNEEVTMHCDISGYFPQKLTVSWQVKERGGNDYVSVDQYMYTCKMTHYQLSDTGYRSAASLHFRPSLSRHHGVWFLCRVTHPSLDAPIERRAGPLLILLPPELRERPVVTPHGADEVLCSVKIRKFFPKKINVNWIKGENCVMASKTILQVNEEEEEAYDAISECKFPRSQLRLPLWVTWEHESMEEPQRFQLEDADLPWSPTVSEIFTPTMRVNEEVKLYCDINGCFPRKLNVSWQVKERGNNDYVPVNRKTYHYKITEDQFSDTGYRSILHFRPSFRCHHGIWFLCRATHPSLDAPIERRAGPLHISLPPRMVEQPVVTPHGADEVLCSVKIRKFFPKKINVTWTKGESHKMALKTIVQVNEEEEEAYDAISECRIPRTQLRLPLRVTWEHESMEEPQGFQLKDTEFSWRPKLQDIKLPVLTDKIEAELQCRISGYFPDAVTVTWYKKEKGARESTPLHHSSMYKPSVAESERLYDSTFSCTARLLFTPTLNDWESEIICRVQHPSLETPLERSSGPLRVLANHHPEETQNHEYSSV